MARWLLVIALAACTAEDRRSAPPPTPTGPAVLSSATQHDLGRDLDDAERLGTWGEVQRRWTGQPLRWQVTRQRALCRSAAACNVSAFGVQRPAPHGWLPLVKFAPGEFAKLERLCREVETCDVVLDGTLEHIVVSPERPTSLTITGARVAVPQVARR